MKNLIEELKRRHVFKVGVAYCLVAWFLIQFSDVVLPTFDAPEWINKSFIFLLIIFFPIAILLAWIYDLTPPRITKTKPIDGESDATDASKTGESKTDAIVAPMGNLAKPSMDTKSIAILPLTNLSPLEENAYFAAGTHEEILNQLSKISDIRVISRTATLRYQDSKQTPREIAQELHVGLILEGSVRYAGNRVRISAELVQAADNSQIWSESYESELDDIFNIQSDVALKVARAMQAKLMPDEVARIERPATANVEAYTLFLRALAREKADGFRITNEEDGWVQAGLRDMQRAIDLDPNFARAHAHLGWIKILKRYTEFNLKEGKQLLAEAKSHAEKALTIDSTVIRAYSVLAFVAFERHQWAEWEELDRKAISFPDAKSGTFLNFADRLGRVGRFNEANQQIDRALTLDPVYAHNREYATYYRLLSRDYDEALNLVETYRAAGGQDGGYHFYRSLAFFFKGQLEDAKNELDLDSSKLEGLHPNVLIFYGYLVANLAGRKPMVKELAKYDADLIRQFMEFGYSLGCKDFDKAFAILKAYMASEHVVSDLGEIMDELRADSRWKTVQKYLKLPEPVLV